MSRDCRDFLPQLKGLRVLDTAVQLQDCSRWKAILDAVITREVTVAAESEGQVKSPD